MKLQIFDVDHGFCAYLIADNGNVMLFDCGYNQNTGFRPSSYLLHRQCTGIENLIIQNFDQDHVADLPNIATALPVTVLTRNPTVNEPNLRAIKQQTGYITDAMEAALTMHARYSQPVTDPPIFPNIEFQSFYNTYPLFQDTNNLSLVSFLHYDGMGIIFPGDLEKAGWKTLLRNSEFRDHLRRTNIFIASHHGRENGYCEEVFNYCTPDVVIISDKPIVHDSQEHDYGLHCKGISWNGGPDKRYVLTTRRDGMITIEKSINSGYHIITQS